eukprot:8627429-Pyramimonas_sp.AAC.1
MEAKLKALMKSGSLNKHGWGLPALRVGHQLGIKLAYCLHTCARVSTLCLVQGKRHKLDTHSPALMSTYLMQEYKALLKTVACQHVSEGACSIGRKRKSTKDVHIESNESKEFATQLKRSCFLELEFTPHVSVPFRKVMPACSRCQKCHPEHTPLVG